MLPLSLFEASGLEAELLAVFSVRLSLPVLWGVGWKAMIIPLSNYEKLSDAEILAFT